MTTILGSLVNIIGGGTYMTIDEHKNLRFDNDKNSHMSSKNHKGKWPWL